MHPLHRLSASETLAAVLLVIYQPLIPGLSVPQLLTADSAQVLETVSAAAVTESAADIPGSQS